MSYIVPIHRPTAVRKALKLSFIGPEDDTLVVAKANRLEFWSPSDDGYSLLSSTTVYGYVTILNKIRLPAADVDHLFVGTDRYQYFTLSWDVVSRSVVTAQSFVDQADKVLRDSRELDKCHIDPTGRFMCLELFDGIITVIPFIQEQERVPPSKKAKKNAGPQKDPGALGDPIQVRTEELQTRASAFLQTDPDSTAPPRLAILWEDNHEVPQLKLRELKYSPGEGNEPATAEMETVRELRADGFLLLGEHSISYVDKDLRQQHQEPLNDNATIWTCWTQVDQSRYLLGDDYGRLFFLMLDDSSGPMQSWKLDSVGEASRASCLVYLDEGRVFVGSHTGDSQIVQIQPGGVEVVQTFPNIAPIVDFSIMDLGRGAETSQAGDFSSGQARILTASGAWQDGSIRSVRSGVGMDELGTIAELPGITELWALSSTGSTEYQDTLVASFVDETRVFKFDSEEALEELSDYQHFELGQPTLLAANLPDEKVAQVFETGVVVSQLQSGMRLLSWRPPEGAKITAAMANSVHLLVVEGGHTLHVFHPSNDKEEPTSSKHFDVSSQISSVTLSDSQSNVCIVSFWQTASVAILDLHTLEPLHTQHLGDPGVAIPRSVLVANILPDAPPTLFVAMADGTVVTFSLDTSNNTLSGMSKILLGTEPVHFKLLPRDDDSDNGLSNVFASCEQPSLIYSSENRIVYSAVSSNKTSRVCSFSSPAYPGAVAIASPDELKLAAIGKERTTQLQTLPIKETVRCLAYEPTAQLFGMGCIDRITESGQEVLTSRIKLANEINFQTLDEVELRDQELVECIITTGQFETEDENFGDMFVVGTSINPDENELSTDTEVVRGRLIVYEVTKEKKIKQVCDQEVKGAVRSLAMCDGRIVAGIVKAVVLYALTPNPTMGFHALELKRLAQSRISSNPMSLSVSPATETSPANIAVADLMKSLAIVEIHQSKGQFTLQEVSRHFATVWSSASAVIGPNQWLLADMEGNLCTLRRDPTGPTPDDRRRLQLTGDFRLGEVVNKIVPISNNTASPTAAKSVKGKERSRTLSTSHQADLSDQPGNQRPPRIGPLITPRAFLGTVEGSIYLHGTISPAYLDVLLRLQRPLAERVAAPGHMPWANYRAWKTQVVEKDEAFRFVDGEVLEGGLLGLDDGVLEQVLKEAGLAGDGFDVTVAEARGWGEELRRLY
ncbi:DNA damage-binding protein 1 [Cyphellophora attinorum]|uniref:DNA damage-binding protein 1 n=1 Tax=Cyphellophora attinorum TaxID=1664694 RepID=A0A0N1H864_9EURO|nr:DNA damage-binding protein 1 [Phialophora attinorum]KPI39176.1 DNA damage-binding protein 1 [Phialophora attinorum]